jgi:hypothetical protein
MSVKRTALEAHVRTARLGRLGEAAGDARETEEDAMVAVRPVCETMAAKPWQREWSQFVIVQISI